MNTRAACVLLLGLQLYWGDGQFLTAHAADAPPANPSDVVQVGDSLADVKRKLGEPRSELEAGGRVVLIYPQGQYILVNGRLTEIPSGLLSSNTPPPVRAPAIPTPGPDKPAPATPSPTVAHPPDVVLVERKDGDGLVTILAQSETNTDFTITFQADLTNMSASYPLPFTADSGGQKSFVLLQLRRDDPTKPWRYSTHFDYHVGGMRDLKTNPAVYVLPYQATESHRLVQGNRGTFSHAAGSQSEYAFDFECKPGTVLCAARAGVVTGVRQDFSEGGTDEKFKTQGNYLIIRHDDGTYAEYYHLQLNGALVKLGQRVGAGQHIALSGATGFASGPHVHFAVFKNTDGKTRVTLPVKFKTTGGVLDVLKEGETY